MDAIALLGWKVLLLVHQSESARMGEQPTQDRIEQEREERNHQPGRPKKPGAHACYYHTPLPLTLSLTELRDLDGAPSQESRAQLLTRIYRTYLHSKQLMEFESVHQTLEAPGLWDTEYNQIFSPRPGWNHSWHVSSHRYTLKAANGIVGWNLEIQWQWALGWVISPYLTPCRNLTITPVTQCLQITFSLDSQDGIALEYGRHYDLTMNSLYPCPALL